MSGAHKETRMRWLRRCLNWTQKQMADHLKMDARDVFFIEEWSHFDFYEVVQRMNALEAQVRERQQRN
jgi:hypothetical protein